MRELPPETWKRFVAQFRRANERVASEMARAGEDVRALLEQLRDRLDSIEPGEAGRGATAAFEWLFRDMADQLFCDPLENFENLRPMGRTLAAIEQHRLEMNDLVRRLPHVVEISGAELAELVPNLRAPWRKAWLKRRKSLRPLRLRQIIIANLWAQILRRARIDEAFEHVLARIGLHLAAAWQLYCRHQLAAQMSGSQDTAAALADERRWWLRTAAELASRAQDLVRSYRRWAEVSPALLERSVMSRSAQFSERRQIRIVARWENDFSRWRRQHRAVRAAIDLERELILVARQSLQITRNAVESLRAEDGEVARELDRAIAWLEAPKEQNTPELLPPPKANLFPAEQRARDWIERISSRVRELLPVEVETVRPSRSVVRWRKIWHQVHPRAVLLHALKHSGLHAASEGLREAESEHTAVIRDIEQARQVVAYGVEVERSEGGSAARLPREAAANALGLLRRRQEIHADPLAAAESALCRAQASTLLETHTALQFGQLGRLALVTRQSAPRAARDLVQNGLMAMRKGSRTASALAGKSLQWTAWKLGWERRVTQNIEPLVEKVTLSVVLEAQRSPRELPALYKRLFSLAPVEDQRFLVGREIEMMGLSRAFSLWQAGQHATVLVDGARGSGKTSLLNCAALVAFPDVPVVRGHFSERIRNPEQMTDFLRNLFQVPGEANLEDALNRRRQVVILEECERSFLRSMNGFEALRGFLRLMSTTSGSTLWILSMNRVSFRYLDAVVGLGRSFSHYINAMSVSQENMTDAILQRHTLSGLRLEFAPLAPGDLRIRRLRRFVGLEQSPQRLFFNALYRQSEGVFRSAFELWLDSIERVEGAVVHMRQPLDPNYKRLEAELKTDDLFLLQAILQHASLTAEESAEVFGIGVEEARRRLERLAALEILEPDPNCPGLRVCPQAGRFVRDALDRQNLL